jgi:beta-N-acetylhexosaminidase
MGSRKLSDFGKNFLVEPSGIQLTDDELRLLDKLQPVAIMFRKRNFLQETDYDTWLAAYEKLLGQCRKVLNHEKLMISLDHEGGRVVRPPLPITRFPYAAFWGVDVANVAQAMAQELKSLGVNVNFAPVADIHSNPENPVINERAFGTTAEYVSRAAVTFAEVLKKNGIAPCAKHFPGHGDTKIDSHYGTPVLEFTFNELKKRELIPFQALIDINVPLVMTAHITFPKIDPKNSATLSKEFLTYLLREEMNFKGVVIADALGMAATANLIKQKENIVKAINAGLDIFLVAGDNINLADATKMAELLQNAYESREVSESAIDKSHERIDKFINALPQYPVTKLDNNTLAEHKRLADKLFNNKPWSNFELSLPGFE